MVAAFSLSSCVRLIAPHAIPAWSMYIPTWLMASAAFFFMVQASMP